MQSGWRLSVMVFCFSLLLVLTAGCSDDEANAPNGDADVPDSEREADADLDGDGEEAVEDEAAENVSFRFAVISDTHIWPDAEHENSVYLTALAAELNALDPPPAFAVITGDCVHDLYCLPDYTCEDPLPILTLYRDLLETAFDMPVFSVIGNHDVRYFDSFLDKPTPLNSWAIAFEGSPLYPGPYYAFDEQGFRFIVLDATDLAYDHASNDLASFGEEQLAWLDTQLSDDLPAVLFWHHWLEPPVTATLDDDANPLFAVLDAHRDSVRATFTGHKHHWDHAEWQGIDFYQTDNLSGNDALPYYLMETDPATGEVRVVNAEDVGDSN